MLLFLLPLLFIFDPDLYYPILFHTKFTGCLFAQVNDPSCYKRPPVIDRDFNSFTVFEIGHFHFCPERKRFMGGRSFVLFKDRSARRSLSLKGIDIKGCFALF